MSSDHGGGSITSVLHETRVFPPPEAFARKAQISSLAQYEALWNRAKDDPEGFWAEQAQSLHWDQPWDKVLDWQPPFAKWFVGGKLNASYNCVDRHCDGPIEEQGGADLGGRAGRPPGLAVPGPPAGGLEVRQRARGDWESRAGDVVAVYMPLVPELVIALLACARIGAPHTVIFGGFSAESLAGRIQDCKAKVLVTADGGYRRGKLVPLKENADGAAALCPTLENVVVYRRTGTHIAWSAGRDHWWHELMDGASATCPAEPLDSEHPLYILYTSGSTGKPKGILHTTGGYLLGTTMTTKWVFDLKDDDTYWCTADVGWVTGHSYLVYGPLANGATCVMYEGAPNWPDEGRFWKIIEDYRVTILYTAPTAIRAFMKWGEQFPRRHDLSSLRLLGTVGEPINPEAWMWYHKVIGGGRCPIVDTWWQTETGAIMISPLPGAIADHAGLGDPTIARHRPGHRHQGREIARDQPGRVPRDQAALAVDAPHSLRRRRALQGSILVRHPRLLLHRRRRPSRRERQLLDHGPGRRRAQRRRPPALDDGDRERAGQPPVGGRGRRGGQARRLERSGHHRVRDPRDPASSPAKHCDRSSAPTSPRRSAPWPGRTRSASPKSLPKTRSGKIMRRLLRDIAAGVESTGDTTTLEDLSVLARLRQKDDEE